MQVPHDPGDDQAGTGENEDIERLAIEPPSDDRDQGNAHEIEGNDDTGIAGAERIAEAKMREQAGGPESDDGGQLVDPDLAHEPGARANQAQPELDDIHPEHDGERALGYRQFL